MERQIEKDAADLLLNRRKELPVPAPVYLRWFGVKHITFWVKSGTYGTGMRRSSYYAGTGIKQQDLENITVDEATKLFALHGDAISKMIAVSILNGFITGFLFTRILAFYLRWTAEPVYMTGVCNWLLFQGSTKDFINTIRSAYHLTMTAPTLSQKVKGS